MGSITEPGLRFLHFAALLGLFGWTAFWLIGLRSLGWLPRDRASSGLIGVAAAAPLLSTALMLASISAMMGLPITALDWPMTEAMILGTDIGTAFLVRTALLITAFGALIARNLTGAALPIAAVCFAGALMTLGWSGHAAATEGGLGLFHRLNNGIHLIAAGLWLGAIGWFLLLTTTAHRQADHVRAQGLLSVMHAFATTGVGLVGTVALTGMINSHLVFGLESGITVLTTTYGVLLAVKVTLVGSMVAFGAHNAHLGRRYARIEDGAVTDPNVTLAKLRRSLAGEFALAVGVTGLVAALGLMSPGMI